jgi:hypothetical protein
MAFFASTPSGPPQAFPDLTDREREVLDLIARGETNAAIAGRLSLSQKTVRKTSRTSLRSCESPTGRMQSFERARPGSGAGGKGSNERADLVPNLPLVCLGDNVAGVYQRSARLSSQVIKGHGQSGWFWA